MADDEVIALVCMPIEDGPAILGFTAPCFSCLCLCNISPASYETWKAQPGVHRVICWPCYFKDMELVEHEVMMPSSGQMQEIINELERRKGDDEAPVS